MKNEINLLKNNDNREDSDKEWIEEFYEFLQGECPDSIRMRRGCQPKLTPKKAFMIIWYLQEHFPLLPDNIEKCWNCMEEKMTKEQENQKLKTPLSQSLFPRFVMWLFKHRCTPWTWKRAGTTRKCTECGMEQMLRFTGAKPKAYSWFNKTAT